MSRTDICPVGAKEKSLPRLSELIALCGFFRTHIRSAVRSEWVRWEYGPPENEKSTSFEVLYSYGYFAQKREYTHTLRLESELSDLRVGYANPCAHADAVRFLDPARGHLPYGQNQSPCRLQASLTRSAAIVAPIFGARCAPSGFDGSTGHQRMKKAPQMRCFILW